jgi:hypothetical protein
MGMDDGVPSSTPTSSKPSGGDWRSKVRQAGQALEPMRKAAQARMTGGQADTSRPGGASQAAQGAVANLRVLGSMKKGGRVHRTGLYRLHAGETVKPARKGTARGRGR